MPDYYEKIIKSKEFISWFGNWESAYKTAGLDFNHPAWKNVSKVVNDFGRPLKVYHGTTHEWTKYSRKLGNHENDTGVGFYATSDRYDADENYLSVGEDLKLRIETTSEYLHNAKKIPYEVAKKNIQKKFKCDVQRTIEVFLKMKNPLMIETKGFKGTNFDFAPIYNEGTGEYSDSMDFTRIKEAFDAVSDDFDFTDKIRDRIWERFIENIGDEDFKSSYEVIGAFKNYDLFENTYDDETGGNAIGEFISQIFRKCGFDGVIYTDASEHFTGMNIPKGTKHFVAYRANQIKLSDGTNTTFSSRNADIRFEGGGELGERPDSKYHTNEVLRFKGYGDVKIVGVAWLIPPLSARSGYIYDFRYDGREAKHDLDSRKKKTDYTGIDFSLYEYEVEMMLESFETGVDYEKSYEKYSSASISQTGNPLLDFNRFIVRLNLSIYYSRHPEFELEQDGSGIAKMSKFAEAYAVYKEGYGDKPTVGDTDNGNENILIEPDEAQLRFGHVLKIRDIQDIKTGDVLGFKYEEEGTDAIYGIGKMEMGGRGEQYGEWSIDGYPFNMGLGDVRRNMGNPEFELNRIYNSDTYWSLYFLKEKMNGEVTDSVSANDKIRILYLHGLGATPQSDNVSILENENVIITAPHLAYDKEPLFEKISNIIEQENIQAIVGHSIGGYLAYYLSDKHRIPCLVFNPAFVQKDFDLQPIPDDVRQKTSHYENKTVVVGAKDDDIPPKVQLDAIWGGHPRVIVEQIYHTIPDDVKLKHFNEFIENIIGGKKDDVKFDDGGSLLPMDSYNLNLTSKGKAKTKEEIILHLETVIESLNKLNEPLETVSVQNNMLFTEIVKNGVCKIGIGVADESQVK